VRELEHAIERAVVLSAGAALDAETLGLLDPARVGAPVASVDGAVVVPHGLALDEAARRYAVATLERTGGNRSAAARELSIGRNRLARLIDVAGDDD
jgi:DNA-binding NtrC family response regulator